jgi:hypothetical protein
MSDNELRLCAKDVADGTVTETAFGPDVVVLIVAVIAIFTLILLYYIYIFIITR